MNNALLNIIDEVIENEGFVVDNDSKAEWCLNKIREEQAETQRFINVCQTMVNEYQFKMQQAQEQLEKKTSGLRSMLQQYFETVPHKSTKTQETYSLPSGKLVKKYQQPEIIRDEPKLLEWVKANGGQEDFVKVKETVDWLHLKKALIQKDTCFVTDDGEIVPGVTLQERPPKFEIEL